MRVGRDAASSAQGRRVGVTGRSPLRCTCTPYVYAVQRTPYGVQLSTVTETKAAARTSLTRERLVQQALAVADAEGIDAVTIRRLATELGVTPMALYWHFKTKDDLLAGAADRVLEDVAVPPPGEDWAED